MATAPAKRGLWDVEGPLRLGVSSCLLGQEVRFDGGHKHDRFLTEGLGAYVEWVPVCPEVEAGMGTPREAVRLNREGDDIRMVGVRSGVDSTSRMRRYAARRVRALGAIDLCGYVLKRGSPSCGMERVRVYEPSGMPRRDGRGLFAEALMQRLPGLPVEEEGRLHDAGLRENFIERIFAYRRLRALFAERVTQRRLVDFHARHKLQIMAHSPAHYRELGPLVAEAKGMPRAELRERYVSGVMEALSRTATRAKHVNVLQHAAGYLRPHLDPDSRAELHALFEEYRAGRVPLIVPITLLRHHVRKWGIDYLASQIYLDPHPKELMLRNHA